MTIKTYYRPDAAFINMLINNLVGGGDGIKEVSGHRFVAVLEATPSTEAYAAVHEHERSIGPSYFGNRPRIEIGVSLSQFDLAQFTQLAKCSRNAAQYFSVVNSIDKLKVTATNVPNLYQGTYGYYWLKELKLSVQEKAFADLLKDFDIYYSYSDDYRVVKNAEARLKVIYDKGKSLGLSTEDMDRIYRAMQ